MGMVVRTNVMAINAYRQLNMNQTKLAKSLEKLASGFRVNRAADDAAGLAISEKMKAQIVGLEAASSNALDGISLVQTAEGALTEVHSMLNRMVTLATKSANGTYQDAVDREAIQAEVNALLDEINRIGDSANFNGIQLLDGSLSATGGKGSNAVNPNYALLKDVFDPKALKITKGDYVPATSTVYQIDQNLIDLLNDELATQGLNFANGDTYGAIEAIAQYLGIDAADYTWVGVTASAANTLDNTGSISFTAQVPGAVDPNWKSVALAGNVPGNLSLAYVSVAGTDAYNKINFVVGPSVADMALIGKKVEVNGKTYTFVGDWDTTMDGVTTFGGLGSPSGAKLADGSYGIYIGGLTDETSLPDAQHYVAQAIADAINVVEPKDTLWSPTSGEVTSVGGAITGTVGLSTNVPLVDVANNIAIISQSLFPKTGGNDIPKSGGLTLQVGDTADDFNKVTVSVDNLKVDGLGLTGLNVSTQEAAGAAIDIIKNAINKVSTNRANLGALQNRLEYTINNLDVMAENMMAANSRIRDTDMAKEMIEYTKMSILVQAAQAMLAQANMQPQSILQLLQ